MCSIDFLEFRYFLELENACRINDRNGIERYFVRKIGILKHARVPYINIYFFNDVHICRKYGYIINKHYDEFLIRHISEL